MHILFDEKINLHATLETVWEVLCSTQQRPKWQLGIDQAVLLSGSEGYRGAKTELTLEGKGEKVIEHVHRSRPLERLQTQFDLGDCSYEQIIYLTRTDEDHTQLTYHCKQHPASGWRRILNMHPAVPGFVKPEIFESLAKYLETSSSPA